MDTKDIDRRNELGNKIDHMFDIGIPNRRAYEAAQEEYRVLNSHLAIESDKHE